MSVSCEPDAGRAEKGPAILIVEDESLVAIHLEDRLTKIGYEVCGVSDSAAEAVAIALAQTPDLVLMDIHLHGERDGIDAAAEIRKIADVPIIFVTAHADDATLKRAGITEPFGYVLKPFDERELKATIEIALYRKRTEQRLRKVEQWLSATLGSMGDGVIATDAYGQIKFINAIGEAITGWSRELALGRHFYDVFVVEKGAEGPPVTDLLERATVDGLAIALEEGHCLRTREGRHVALDDSIAPIRERDGTLTGYVTVFRDATARKEAQEERLRLEEKMREALRLESLGQVASGVAHDFNNLLVAVTLNTSLARTLVREGTPMAELLDEIKTAASRAARLCNQMLAYAGGGSLVMRALNLNSFVREAAPLLKVVIQNHATLALNLEESLPPILADGAELYQMVMNLVLNASEALGEGSGCLSIGTRRFRADQSFLAECRLNSELSEGEYVLLEVSDPGHGMSPETLTRIFDPFFTTKFTGRGLGLSAVLGIVRAHGGAIHVESTPGQGTTFRILFPRASSPPVVGTARAVNMSWKTSGRALLIDDEPIVRLAATHALRHCGFEVETAENGRQAIQKLLERAGGYRVVLLDLTMPELHGDYVLKVIRTHFPRLPVVIMSGYTERKVKPLYEEDSGTVFMQKPFSLEKLVEKLTLLLGES
ncbi:MAG: response regulator [Verrucomicrobia bacterium]|nr:response regulator [Verrucomicrobiota bacterium]